MPNSERSQSVQEPTIPFVWWIDCVCWIVIICFILLYLTSSQSPFLIRCLVYRALVQRLVLSNRFEIRLWVAIQNEVGIRQRVIVDKIVKLWPLIHIVGNFVFDGGAVNSNHTATAILQSRWILPHCSAVLASFCASAAGKRENEGVPETPKIQPVSEKAEAILCLRNMRYFRCYELHR